MAEKNKAITAFTLGPLGFYECTGMPFGLTNALGTFQHLMENCLGDLQLNWCTIYLDDIIVFAVTLKEHLKCLKAVFDKLWIAGLKFKPNKYEFFKTQIVYLGHVVSKEGIQTDTTKTDAIKTWLRPSIVTKVQKALEFTNYYRRLIKGYAKITSPLYALVSGENASKRNKPIKWTEQCEEAFNEVQRQCTSAPLLAFADFSKPVKLDINVSGIGLGAVVYQEQDGVDCITGYGSQGLNKGKANYTVHKLEFLSLKWAVTNCFHEYLHGNTFTVYSDNNQLTYVLTMVQLVATGHGWVSQLATLNFNLLYRWVPLKLDFLGAWKSVRLKHYLAYPVTIISLIIQRNLGTKIWAEQESGLTAVWLKWDPPVDMVKLT